MPQSRNSETASSSEEGDRIAKVLARAGLCSRRDAEKLIADGRVAVNGKVLDTPAVRVTLRDQITVDNIPVAAPEETRLWRYHKPDGLVTTARDPQGRPTVFERLPKGLPRVISVGRLDLTSEGLMLLTNDGGLARWLELPSTGWTRHYRVRAHGRVSEDALAALAEGATVDGVTYGPVEATMEREQGSNIWLTIALKEGKNREVRKLLDHLGLKVNRLIRTAYGPFALGRLPRGQVAEVKGHVLRAQFKSFFASGQGKAPTPIRARHSRDG